MTHTRAERLIFPSPEHVGRSIGRRRTTRLLFVDFDGTLCHGRFWAQLPSAEYEALQREVFSARQEAVQQWMRGHFNARDICKLASEVTQLPADYLFRALLESCVAFEIEKPLLTLVRKLKAQQPVVLLTSNMDCFSLVVQKLELDQVFDTIVSSYDYGLLKSDENGSLFRRVANAYDVPLRNCALIDDSRAVCELFREIGGLAHWVSEPGLARSFLAAPWQSALELVA